MEERQWFGPFNSSILAKYSFKPVREYRDEGQVALDVAGPDLGLRLVHDVYGSDILITPADDLDDQYALELVLNYLTGHSITTRSMDELAALFEAHYDQIADLFRRRPGGRWNEFTAWLEELNRARFHYDRVRKQ